MWLKLGGGFLILAVIGLAIWLYGGARYKQGKADEAQAWTQKVVQAERDKLAAYQAGVARGQAAEAGYHETIRERVVPITKTIIERAAAYAQTPDGSSLCLPAERVSWLEQTRSSLFPSAAPAPASSGDSTMLANPEGTQP
jgi:hypothetical protein